MGDSVRLFQVLGMLLLAMACNGQTRSITPSVATGGAPGKPIPRAVDWYPLLRGATWEYEVSKEAVIRLGAEERRTTKPGTMTDRCLGSSPDDPSVWVLRRRIEEHNPRLADPVVLIVDERLSVRDDTISALSIQQEGRAMVMYESPHPVFSLELNRRRTTQTVDALQLDVAQVSQSVESVTVPAGNYREAIKRVLRGSLRGRLGGARVERGTVEESTWFALGVGPVRVQRTMEMDLHAGSVPAKAEEVMVRVLRRFSRHGDVSGHK